MSRIIFFYTFLPHLNPLYPTYPLQLELRSILFLRVENGILWILLGGIILIIRIYIYIYTETSNRLVFANNRRDRELRKRQQVHVGAYVKRRNVLERFVARFDGACRGVAERARVDQFQSKAGCHSSRLDYSARIFPLSHSLSRISPRLLAKFMRPAIIITRLLPLLVLSVNSPASRLLYLDPPRLSLSAARSSS